jgi:hypothetical protein
MTAAILELRPAAVPGARQPNAVEGRESDLVRLFAFDNLSVVRRRLVCHWRRDADGRLACFWEPDIASVPHA